MPISGDLRVPVRPIRRSESRHSKCYFGRGKDPRTIQLRRFLRCGRLQIDDASDGPGQASECGGCSAGASGAQALKGAATQRERAVRLMRRSCPTLIAAKLRGPNAMSISMSMYLLSHAL